MCDCKQCSTCRRLLPVTTFPRDRSRRDGLSHRCRRCVSERNAKAYKRRKGALGADYKARGWVAATTADGCQIN